MSKDSLTLAEKIPLIFLETKTIDEHILCFVLLCNQKFESLFTIIEKATIAAYHFQVHMLDKKRLFRKGYPKFYDPLHVKAGMLDLQFKTKCLRA
jgi:hypothetical protein